MGAADSPKVPVVCLERLKVLVSRLPPHGRRQSDPLPAGAGACSQRPARADGRGQVGDICSLGCSLKVQVLVYEGKAGVLI